MAPFPTEDCDKHLQKIEVREINNYPNQVNVEMNAGSENLNLTNESKQWKV